jgi:hypothetical protein
MAGGYELTEQEFWLLISDRAYRRRIARVLRGWGYRLTGFEVATIVADDTGQVVDPAILFGAIQRDPARQHDLYQVAMDLWR